MASKKEIHGLKRGHDVWVVGTVVKFDVKEGKVSFGNKISGSIKRHFVTQRVKYCPTVANFFITLFYPVNWDHLETREFGILGFEQTFYFGDYGLRDVPYNFHRIFLTKKKAQRYLARLEALILSKQELRIVEKMTRNRQWDEDFPDPGELEETEWYAEDETF